jgi:hypothetical protein
MDCKNIDLQREMEEKARQTETKLGAIARTCQNGQRVPVSVRRVRRDTGLGSCPSARPTERRALPTWLRMAARSQFHPGLNRRPRCSVLPSPWPR